MKHVKAKVNLINKEHPTTDIYEYNEKSRKETKRVIQRFYCKIGDELIVLSESVYTYRDGFFYALQNKKGETFFLDSKEAEEFTPKKKKFNLLD